MSGRCREKKSKRQKNRARTSEGEGCSCVAWDHSRCGAIPLTNPNGPGRDDPGGDAEDQQHGARADGHEGLHDEACVEVDLVEGTYTSRGCVGEELAMKEHDPANQVEAEEHRDGKNDVYVGIGHRGHVGESQPGRPCEHILARDWVNGTHQQLQDNKEDALICHGYPPVIRPIVHHEQLQGTGEERGVLAEKSRGTLCSSGKHI